MHITFDYLAVGVIIFAFMTFAVSLVYPSIYSPLTQIKEEQVEPLTEKILKKVSSTPGSPDNWGTAYSFVGNTSMIVQNLTGFGLSYFVGGSVIPDHLDADKVARLVPTTSTGATNPLYINRSDVANLLGLTWDGTNLRYGMSLTLRQALNITATPTQYVDGFAYAFDAYVKNSEEDPAAGANVKSTFVIFYMQGSDMNYTYFQVQGKTDWRGYVNIAFNKTAVDNILKKGTKPSVMFVAYAEYYGIKSQTVQYQGSDVLEATVVGDNLFLEFPTNSTFPQGARHVRGAFGISYNNVVEMPIWQKKGGEAQYVINQGSKSYAVFNLGDVDQTLDSIGVYVIFLGKPTLVFAKHPPNYVQFGWTTGSEGKKVAVMRRMVEIGELSYWMEIDMWRTAEL